VNGKLRECLAVEEHFFRLQNLDETRVRNTLRTQCCTETDDPETAKIALLESAILVRIHTGTNDSLIGFHERRAAHAPIALGKLADFLVPAMTDYTSFNAHGKGGLEIWEETLERFHIPRIGNHCAADALLALVLLKEKMIATVSLERKFAASGLPNTFLGAAVGLQFRHEKEEIRGKDAPV
jgi:hypothetical protein